MDTKQQWLKWGELEADASLLLTRDEATCFLATDKVHALGCSHGLVHILDFEGHRINSMNVDRSAVTALAMDASMEHLVIATEAGHVHVCFIHDGKVLWKADAGSEVSCVAVNPEHSDKVQQVLVATAAGTLALHRRGWLGNTQHTVSSGEGRIHAVMWLTSAIVWATDVGLSAIPPNLHAAPCVLPRRPSAGSGACSICAVRDSVVLAAWPHMIQVIRIKANPTAASVAGLVPEVLHEFDVPYRALGIAPFGANMAILADVARDVCRPDVQQRSRLQQIDAPSPSSIPAESAAKAQQCDSTSSIAASRACDGHNENPANGQKDGSSQGTADDRSGDDIAASNGSESGVLPERSSGSIAEGPTKEAAEGDVEENGAATECVDAEGSDATRQDAVAAPSSSADAAVFDAQNARVQAVNADSAIGVTEHGPHLQLRIVSLSGAVLRHDDLDKRVSQHGSRRLCHLVAFYPTQYHSLMTQHLAARPVSTIKSASPSANNDEKWWRDDNEPLYYVLTPDCILLGRPCDADDQVLWLLDQCRYEAAMMAADAAAYVRPDTWTACSTAYLNYLIDTEDFSGAANVATRLLGDDREAWERLLFAFGQKQQLPVLAPYVPVEKPRLNANSYSMVLMSFLPHRNLHASMLELLQSWPSSIIDPLSDMLISNISRHLSRFPQTQMSDLRSALALLHRLQGHHLQALEIWLQLREPAVFPYIAKFHLYEAAARNANALMEIDQQHAIDLLVQQHDQADVRTVGAVLQRHIQSAKNAKNSAQETLCRRRLFEYLHALFVRARIVEHGLEDLMVELYAEFSPDELLRFLQSSKHYHRKKALQVCRRVGRTPEQVYILGRMGHTSEALALIVSDLSDLPQAIEFVSSQNEDALWDELIAHVASSSELMGELLDQIGGHVDPLRLVRVIPEDLAIPSLNVRLSNVIRRFRTNVELKRRCNDIVVADCVALAERLVATRVSPVRRSYVWDDTPGPSSGDGASPSGRWLAYDSLTGVLEPCASPDVPQSAASFAEPVHLCGHGVRERVAAHANLEVERRTRERAQGALAGLHAISDSATRQAVQQLAAALSSESRGLRVWA